MSPVPDRGSTLGRPVEFAKELARLGPLFEANGYHIVSGEDMVQWPLTLMGFLFNEQEYPIGDMEYSASSESVQIPAASCCFWARFVGQWTYVGFIRTAAGQKKTIGGTHVYKIVSGLSGSCDVFVRGYPGQLAVPLCRLTDENTSDAYGVEVRFPLEYLRPDLV